MDATTVERMTAAEFLAKYGDCSGVELVRGRVVWAGREPQEAGSGQVPHFKHGVVCQNVALLLGGFIKASGLGWVAVNDTFVPTGPTATSVRGADFLYLSFARLPKGNTPDVLTVPPELVVEVRSPTDRMTSILAKVAEYIDAGVSVVLVIDPKKEAVVIYRGEELPQVRHNGDELTLPDVLPGFAVPVRQFFE